MRRHALLACMVLAWGCSPSLRDGQYGCPDQSCPSTMTCWDDHFCHYGTQPDGSIPGSDGGMVLGDAGFTCGGTNHGTCPRLQMCVVGSWGMPMPSLGCADLPMINNNQHGNACTPGNVGQCSSPDICITNAGSAHCMRPCGPMGEDCNFAEDCILPASATPMGHVCALPCGAGCGGRSGFTCSGGYCLPAGW